MNQVFTHPGQPQMQAEVILASQGPDHKPIYTVRMRYPRIIHGEVMTHRVFSRNARSSRAVPVKTMLLECTTIPYVPWHWGKNQSGMQASEKCDALIPYEGEGVYFSAATREQLWLHARDAAVNVAEAYMEMGYHKQIPNRLLEPFSWIDTLVTSTEWDNFFWLRDHKDAEPHLQDLARLVKQAVDAAKVQELKTEEWHLPYIKEIDIYDLFVNPSKDVDRMIDELGCDEEEILNMISAARCARISYKPFNGDASYEKELERYEMLVSSDRVHASPTEHQATPDAWVEPHNPYEGRAHWEKPRLHGNLTGYVQFRKTVPNENHS